MQSLAPDEPAIARGWRAYYSGTMGFPSLIDILAWLVRKLPALVSPEYLGTVLHLYRNLQRWLSGSRRAGIYEVLEYEATLELLDGKGRHALFCKRQKVKFLQDHVIAIHDYVWGDGWPCIGFSCAPGVVVDHFQEGDRQAMLISLREIKSCGDVETFHVQYRLKQSFVCDEEWWQLSMQNPTRQVKLSIIFPKRRPCRRAVLEERSRHRSTVLGQEWISFLPDQRQVLTWETRRPRRLEVYTLRWWW